MPFFFGVSVDIKMFKFIFHAAKEGRLDLLTPCIWLNSGLHIALMTAVPFALFLLLKGSIRSHCSAYNWQHLHKFQRFCVLFVTFNVVAANLSTVRVSERIGVERNLNL